MSTSLQDGLERLLEELDRFVVVLQEGSRLAVGSPPLSTASRFVLKLLAREPGLTVPQIARQRGRSRQNIQVLADRLAEAGLVRYTTNCDHCRSERLQLTAAAKRALEASSRAELERRTEILPQVSADDLQTCIQVLRTVRAGWWPKAASRPSRSGQVGAPSPAASPLSPEVPEGWMSGVAAEAEPESSPPDSLPVSLL